MSRCRFWYSHDPEKARRSVLLRQGIRPSRTYILGDSGYPIHWRVLRNPIETNLEIVPHVIIDAIDIISNQELINNGIVSEINTIHNNERDLVANYIFSKRKKHLIYQNDLSETQENGSKVELTNNESEIE
ncbi:hypothetical protein Glove_71g89 [Diversispora epigaea]|uniref:DDE Tnp4 domain-containing protein n=1 Tax=Diversispora epigaea TaxID=1348612 RepID=A0A397JKT1_9GLOM|nr:hypothetical protein Glove_71g89 [Diversispora epigaea]